MTRKREIIRRATEVFDRQGYSRTSLEDIAKATGITREAIYYYFKNRSDILVEVILPDSKSLLSDIRSIVESDASAPEKMRLAIRRHLANFNPNYLEMSVALREHHFFETSDKLSELRQVWKEYNACWARLVREGQASGEFRAGLDPQTVAYGLLGMFNWLARWYDPAKRITIDEIIDTYSTVLFDGIMTDGAAAAAPRESAMAAVEPATPDAA